MTNTFGNRLSIRIVMRNYVNRQITRLWLWLLTAGTHRDSSATSCIAPGDEERLLQALINMNQTLARAAR